MEGIILLLIILIFGLPIFLFILTRIQISDKTDRIERKINKLSNDLAGTKYRREVGTETTSETEWKYTSPKYPEPKKDPAVKKDPAPKDPPVSKEPAKPKPAPKIPDIKPSLSKQEKPEDHSKYMPKKKEEEKKQEPVYSLSAPVSKPEKEIKPKKQEEKSKFSFTKNYPDLEKFIGENLINKIGIGVLVLGIGYFVKYAIDQNWINEIERVIVGMLSGGILLGFAHKMRQEFKAFSSVLVGGGLAIFYFTIAIAFNEYHLLSELSAFVIMVAITGFSILLSIAYDRKELAILAIIGGFASPYMTGTTEGNYIILLSYIMILNIGMLVLAYFKKWNVLNIISYVATIILYGSWLSLKVIDIPEAPYVGALIYGTLFYLTFFMMNIINNVKENQKFNASEISILISNTFLYFTAGLLILQHVDHGIYKGLFTALVGIFNFLFAFSLYKNKKVDTNLVYLLIGLTLTFISLTAPIQLEGNRITLFWSVEAVLLLWLSQKSGIHLIKKASVIVMLLMFISLIMDWMNIYDAYEQSAVLAIIFNKGFITSMVSILSIGATIFLLKKEKDEPIFPGHNVTFYRNMLSGTLVLFLYISMLLELCYQLSQYIEFDSTRAMIIGGFNLAYIASIILIAKIKEAPIGVQWSSCLGVVGILTYMMYYHFEIISVRNEHLTGDAVSLYNYLFHYLDTALIVMILFLLLQNIRKYYGIRTQIGNTFILFASVVSVFLVSAELDHFIVFSNYLPGASISYITSQTHKIGYPILWGVCSFALMFVGMRNKMKEIRIISLTLFFITLVKLFMFDIVDISEGGKIAAFISLGVLLLIISFMYQKLKNLILEDKAENSN